MPPRVADSLVRVQDHERQIALLQVIPRRETRLAATDDDGLPLIPSHLVARLTDGGLRKHRADYPESLLPVSG
jgi:hypothetical protein